MLYHVSLSKIDKFELKIPCEKSDNENSTIKRICFSRTIEGAFSAIPRNFQVLDGYLNLKKEFNISPIFYVYMIDEKDLDRKDIIKSSVLKKKMNVLDAIHTSEVWVLTDNIKVSCKVIEVEDFLFDRIRLDNYNRIWKIINLKYRNLSHDDDSLVRTERFWDMLKTRMKEQYNKEFNGYLFRYFISSKSALHVK